MSRNFCSNSSAPPLFPLPDQPSINIAAEGAGSGAGAPEVVSPVVILNENPLNGNFNHGTVAGQKIFLEKKKVLATEGQLPLLNVSAKNIMKILTMKEHLMGTVITRVPTVYTAGIGISPMNLINQIPLIPLEIVQ